VTDGQTDGIAVASTALAMRRAVKKNLLNGNIFTTCPQNMVNFGPLTAEIGWPTKPCTMFWPSPGLTLYENISGAFAP